MDCISCGEIPSRTTLAEARAMPPPPPRKLPRLARVPFCLVMNVTLKPPMSTSFLPAKALGVIVSKEGPPGGAWLLMPPPPVVTQPVRMKMAIRDKRKAALPRPVRRSLHCRPLVEQNSAGPPYFWRICEKFMSLLLSGYSCGLSVSAGALPWSGHIESSQNFGDNFIRNKTR